MNFLFLLILILIVVFIILSIVIWRKTILNQIILTGGCDAIKEFAQQVQETMSTVMSEHGGSDYYLIAGPAMIMHGLRPVETDKKLSDKIRDLDAYVKDLPKYQLEVDIDEVTVDLHNETLRPQEKPFWAGLEERMRNGEYSEKYGVKFMTLQMLLEMKEYLNREKDQQDIRKLKAALAVDN